MRLDLFLVEKQLAPSRTQAQEMIRNGFVFLQTSEKKIKILKPSFMVEDSQSELVSVEDNHFQKYVSRAGLKLESALLRLKLNVQNLRILDIGQSTGGFTDCLLQFGAAHVTGVDVGHGQLHESLKSDARILPIEGLNAKDMAQDERLKPRFDLIVADVSFISITKVIPYLPELLKDGGIYLLLVKPQFECGPEGLDRNGVVRNSKLFPAVEKQVREAALQYFNHVGDYFESQLPGKDGNQEFFIYGQNS